MIVIPKEIRETLINNLKEAHIKKRGYTKEVKSNLQREITLLENRITNSIELKLDGTITHDDWIKYNNKWQQDKDRLMIQLQGINDFDKEFNERTGRMLSFLDNAHDLFLKGNIYQRRKILEIISEAILYKNKRIEIKLRPFFEDLVKKQYVMLRKNLKIET